MNLESPVNSIKGIGAEREKYLRKLNIVTVGDIIEHYPRDYEDRTCLLYTSGMMDYGSGINAGMQRPFIADANPILDNKDVYKRQIQSGSYLRAG